MDKIDIESASQKAKIGDVPPNQEAGVPLPKSLGAVEVSPEGGRQVFRDIRRQLTDEELKNTGVQKLLLNMFEKAEGECERLRNFVDRFHEADKRAAVLEASQRTNKAIEIIFGVGVGLGGAIIGLTPLFWSDPPKGHIALLIGVLLVAGASIARAVKR